MNSPRIYLGVEEARIKMNPVGVTYINKHRTPNIEYGIMNIELRILNDEVQPYRFTWCR